MAFKGESYIPLIIRVKPTEGDIWRVRDNGMLFGIPLKGGDFIEWTGAAWQLRPDLHYKLDDGSSHTILECALPIRQDENGVVSNNGQHLVVTGDNAWAEGDGEITTKYVTADVSESATVPVSSLYNIELGMICDIDGGRTIVSIDAAHSTITLNAAVTLEANTGVLIQTGATGNRAHAEGYGCTASGGESHAEGYKTRAIGADAHAEGSRTIAHDYAHSEGGESIAIGTYSHAEGCETIALGAHSHAGGTRMIAVGNDAFAHGFSYGSNSATISEVVIDEGGTTCTLEVDDMPDAPKYKARIGNTVVTYTVVDSTHINCPVAADIYVGQTVHYLQAGAFGNQSVALGHDAFAEEYGGIAIGDAKAFGYQAIAIGYGVVAHAHATAIGEDADATGMQAVAIGRAATANGSAAVAIGANSYANVDAAAINGGRAYSWNSVALGHSIAGGINTISGNSGIAIGSYSASFGYGQSDAITAEITDIQYDLDSNQVLTLSLNGTLPVGSTLAIYSQNGGASCTITTQDDDTIATLASSLDVAVGDEVTIANHGSGGSGSFNCGIATRIMSTGGMACGEYNLDETAKFVIGEGTNAGCADCFKIDANGKLWFKNSNGVLTDLATLLAAHNIT